MTTAAPFVRSARVSDAAAVATLLDELGYPRPSAAEAAGRLRACYCVELALRPFVEIMALIVADAHRGAGLGGALVEASAEWARGLGVEEVCVRARVERLRAPAFYEGHGFGLDKLQNVFVRKLNVEGGRPQA